MPNECKAAPDLLVKVEAAEVVIADRGYDSAKIRELIHLQKSKLIISRKCNSTIGNEDIDWCLYKYRHLVENAFAKLKHFRGVATRFDKLKQNFISVIALACSYIWLPM